jgi:DNA-binding SARP family transcriptional activator
VARLGGAILSARLLGGLEVRRDGTAIRFPTRHSGLMFAILASDPGAPVARARIAELLWPARGEEQARGSLRQTLYRLRQALGEAGDRVAADAASVLIDPAAVWCDAAELTAGRIDPDTLSSGRFLDGWDGLSPALDNWIAERRGQLAARAAGVLREAAAEADRRGDPRHRRALRRVVRGGGRAA